ncbi:MAG TPA: cell division protein ZipA C-terminal FtsZ-binding domain-containing protein [Cytophagales bacterium]|nr:cell division protein ZipA C-terminal FtsZ-binding domain-containing protein [Cytophagales bacterium]
MDSNYAISTSSESEERAKSVLPLKGKEDVSDLLSLNIKKPVDLRVSEETKYFANEKYDWIITIEPESNSYFDRDSISKYFNKEWRANYQNPWLYCIPKNDSKWTYFSSGKEELNELIKVALGWKLYDNLDSQPSIYDEKTLVKYHNDVNEITKKLNCKLIRENYSAREAAIKSQELSEFIPENNIYSIIILKADQKFEGKEIWDVMMSLGLKWGDMDLFHWNNDHDFGDDQLISVWTSTNPGYFFPEEIAAGRVQTEDLIFGFSIPRSIAPKEILEVMYKVANYSQYRLGGQLLDENGLPFDIAKERNKIENVLGNLKSKSIEPGIGDALYLF